MTEEKIEDLSNILEHIKIIEDISGDGKSILDDNKKIIDEINSKNLSCDVEEKPKSKTGLIYDERMTAYRCDFPHPECPERISRIYQKLLDNNLVSRCCVLQSRLARKEEIITKHSEKQYEFILSLENKSEEELGKLAEDLNSIYLHKSVTECALLSAGCTLELVEQVLNGNLLNGAAVIRPPGHHAVENCSMGFCHFNNVALAAMMAIEKFQLSRILILDWDVHYGNATHQMFDDDPRVLYFSLHRYDYTQFWPHLSEANYDAVGKGKGQGYNVHVAWNKSKIQSSSYLYAFDNLLLPMLKDYDPELVLVSAGFDSGIGDPLGGCKVAPTGYAEMTKRLMQFANGKVVILLEGGYNLATISDSMSCCVSTLLGDDIPQFLPHEAGKPSDSALRSIMKTYFTHLPFWKDALEPLKKIFEDLKTRLDQEDTSVKDESSSSEDESPDFVKS